MALRGTLKDFGIADIFQLIGHQTKSGVLRLKSRDSDIAISFREGNVVKAESATRQKKDLLGHMLVRAGVVSDSQLEAALDDQRRTLRKLGDVLITHGAINKENLTEFMRLQTTETIYRLFSWQTGTYEFEQGDIERDPDFGEPIRAESVLMEGFRMVDEWPMIRKRISGYGMTFDKLKMLPEPKAAKEDELDFDMGAPSSASSDGQVGAAERKLFDLITPDRDVQKLVDMSRMGEFEACKALSTLLDQGYLRVSGSDKHSKNPPLMQGGLGANQRRTSLVLTAVVMLGLLAAIGLTVRASTAGGSAINANASIPDAMKMALAQSQRRRISHALEISRAEDGHYPASLMRLVELRLLETSDLDFPVGRPFIYRNTPTSYELAPSLP
jgi:hypothetical protein